MDITLLTFAFIVFVTVVTPGPTVLLALTNGSRFGMRRAGIGMLGAAVSDLVLIAAAAVGLGAVLATSAFWFGVVKWLGVAYLAWLGLQLLRSAGEFGAGTGCSRSEAENGAGSSRRIFQKCFLVAVTNPKGYLFFAAFLPQFIDSARPLTGQYVKLALLFVLIDLVTMGAYAALGAHAVRFLRQSGAIWLERGSGAVLLVLAGTLAMYRRANA
ncbi:MAG: LysE family translocator [Hyphomicrobiales bacterium]|nr:LysE family translocator [Hyphomicrobiales bacterium]